MPYNFGTVFTYVIFNMRDVAISPKYNFEKLLRKLTISDFLLIENLQGMMYSVINGKSPKMP